MTLCNSELALFSSSSLAIPYLPFFSFILLLHSIPNILRALCQVFRPLTRALSAWSPQTQSSPLVRIWQCWPVAIYRNRWNANCQNRIIKFPYFPTDVPSKSLSVYKYFSCVNSLHFQGGKHWMFECFVPRSKYQMSENIYSWIGQSQTF